MSGEEYDDDELEQEWEDEDDFQFYGEDDCDLDSLEQED
jgi:hypothetical protein